VTFCERMLKRLRREGRIRVPTATVNDLMRLASRDDARVRWSVECVDGHATIIDREHVSHSGGEA